MTTSLKKQRMIKKSRAVAQCKKTNAIPINIWDDYYDDGFIPKGKRQETDMRITDGGFYPEYGSKFKKLAMSYLYTFLLYLENGFQCQFAHLNSVQIIYIRDLTHKNREKLVNFLKKAKLSYKGVPFLFYSES